jgi:hypothetical protein
VDGVPAPSFTSGGVESEPPDDAAVTGGGWHPGAVAWASNVGKLVVTLAGRPRMNTTSVAHGGTGREYDEVPFGAGLTVTADSRASCVPLR